MIVHNPHFEVNSYAVGFSQNTNISLHRGWVPPWRLFLFKITTNMEGSMFFGYIKFSLLGIAFLLILATLHQANASEPEATPKPRDIPGITTDDMFPSGCVNCHLNFADRNMDTRISTSLGKWAEKVEPKLLAKAQAATPKGITLTGKHPSAEDSLTNIPRACIECHKSMSQSAPSFSQMVHLIHLTGGQENHYITLFKGECTHCHKLNKNTGEWSLPSGRE